MKNNNFKEEGNNFLKKVLIKLRKGDLWSKYSLYIYIYIIIIFLNLTILYLSMYVNILL
jgi:hypothetical protein